MNDNELKLLEGLRGLAAEGPRQAPALVEERLVGELRRRSLAGSGDVGRYCGSSRGDALDSNRA